MLPGPNNGFCCDVLMAGCKQYESMDKSINATLKRFLDQLAVPHSFYKNFIAKQFVFVTLNEDIVPTEYSDGVRVAL